jgi:hypothetical protein
MYVMICLLYGLKNCSLCQVMRDSIGQRLTNAIDSQDVDALGVAFDDAKVYVRATAGPEEKVYFKNRDHLLYLRDAEEILLVLKEVCVILRCVWLLV